MSEQNSIPKMDSRPPEARITDESIAAAKEMVGTILRPEGPFIQDVTVDTIRTYCNGIGDLNPLYRDAEYGRRSRYASIIAHPTLPMAYGYIGRTRWGFSGVHGFLAGNDWEFFQAWRPGQRMNCIERVVGVEEKTSKLSGRMVLQYTEALWLNQDDELMARTLGWCTRHERRASRESGKHTGVKTHSYTVEEMEKIDEMVLNEPNRIRGSKVRYWQDVKEGEEIDSIVRGPLTAMDLKGFNVGVGRGLTHGLVLQNAKRHPGHYFRNPEAGGGIEYTGIGHLRASQAGTVGVPSAYDYGPGRVSWLTTLVSNWMGDSAFLKRLRGELRRFNIVGDTMWLKGKVAKKYVKDGYALVDLEIWAENQRGELTAPGLATVMLPSKDLTHKPVVDGSKLDLELPIVR